MQYTEYHLITTEETVAEILLALLAEFGFDTFEQNEKELYAYISSDLIKSNQIDLKIQELQTQFQFSYSSKIYEDKNWNEEWEKNFQPVVVAEKIIIRAPFHKSHPKYPYELIIEPRMSFGTGHHESTYLMLEMMLRFEFEGMQVFDAGCGTGILAIFASLLGAENVTAVDNNEWAYNNTLDNITLNTAVKNIKVVLSELDILQHSSYDFILANINKPIILENLSLIKSSLSVSGTLLLSGILSSDLQEVMQAAQNEGLTIRDVSKKGDWVCLYASF